MSELMVTTRTADDVTGSRVMYDGSGRISSQASVARARGTTVALRELFKPLPVRRKAQSHQMLSAVVSAHLNNATAGNAVCLYVSFPQALICVVASTGAAQECEARIWKAAQSPSGICCHWHRSPAHMHKPGERAPCSHLLSPSTLCGGLLLSFLALVEPEI